MLIAQLFFITSCEQNAQSSCIDFAVSIDHEIIDSSAAILTAVTAGGVPDYTFTWNTGATTPSITVTEFDTYSVTVTDGNTCTASIDFVIDADSLNNICDGFYATIAEDVGSNSSYLTAMANGGTGPYTYEWSTNETAETIEVNVPANYTVLITDANGCTSSWTMTYVQGGGLCDYPVYIELVVDPVTADTSLYVVIDSSATGPFTYEWSNGATTESTIIIGLGTYWVTVTDANGCVHTVTYEHLMNGPCSNYDVYIASFPDSNSVYVALSADVIGGSSPFVYNWSNGENIPVISVEENTGSYTVTVTDANGCIDEDTIQI